LSSGICAANQFGMLHLGLVVIGGGIGAGCRHLANLLALRLFGAGFPVGTLTVNVVGGLLMGMLTGYFAFRYAGGGQGLRLFLATGILGGFTTFSAFSLDALLLWERGAVVMAVLYVVGSVVLSIAALVAGLAVLRALT
jgi:fluoride exporter